MIVSDNLQQVEGIEWDKKIKLKKNNATATKFKDLYNNDDLKTNITCIVWCYDI